jgi:hypothetical protein
MRSYCEQTWENDKAYYSSFFDTPEQGLHFIFNELAFRGSQHLEVELDANTEFILWAFGMDDEALMNTTPEFYTFKTGGVKASENTFVLSVTELYPRKATVKVEPSNDDPYVAALVAGDPVDDCNEHAGADDGDNDIRKACRGVKANHGE